MTDTIASRVTRVIGSSVHALLDAVENAAPEAAMAQAIREVEAATDEVRAELGRVEAVKHLATSSLNKLNTQMEQALRDFTAACAASTSSPGPNLSSGTTQGKVERAGSAFDRVLARQTGITGATSALNPDASKLHELQELARTHRIDERLAALKAARADRR